MPLHAYRASRILRAMKRGSSSPLVVQTAGGRYLMKLRGAAQGIPPLIAEVVVAELATRLGLSVPDRAVVELDGDVPTDDRNDELLDLLARSSGANLGIRWLDGARDLGPAEADLVDPDTAARILWLDGLVMNADRTVANPNLLLWNGQPWLIDHGASLLFHYDWSSVTEQAPREDGFDGSAHFLHSAADRVAAVDAESARAISRDALNAALDVVPNEFLSSAFPSEDPRRMRAAYVAFLWKRLAAPRPFV